MPRDRVMMRLVVSSILAVLLHVALLPASAAWRLHRQRTLAEQVAETMQEAESASTPASEAPSEPPPQANDAEPEPEREPEPEPDVMLGREDAPMRMRVAWIPFDEFERLQAPRSRTEQPVVQQLADPVPGAPLEINATAAPPGFEPDVLESRVEVTVPASQDLLAAVPLPEALPLRPAPVDAPQFTVPASAQEASEAQEAHEAGGVPRPAEASAPEEPRPTSAPRGDRESIPTTLAFTGYEIKPGQVLVGQGLEVRTVVPRFGQVARYAAAPRNARVSITFAVTGEVIEARILESSGYATVDSPILSSLYKWTATGTTLQKRGRPLEIRITILLGGEE